jgi:aldehyde dehydrogenase (NAD+)
VIDSTANLAIAAKRIAWGAFMNAGQTCIRPDYLMVHASVADALLKLLKATIVDFYGSGPGGAQASEFYGRYVLVCPQLFALN